MTRNLSTVALSADNFRLEKPRSTSSVINEIGLGVLTRITPVALNLKNTSSTDA